jgi:hypothetical protein
VQGEIAYLGPALVEAGPFIRIRASRLGPTNVPVSTKRCNGPYRYILDWVSPRPGGPAQFSYLIDTYDVEKADPLDFDNMGSDSFAGRAPQLSNEGAREA